MIKLNIWFVKILIKSIKNDKATFNYRQITKLCIGFSIFGLCDLVSDPRQPILEPEPEILKTTFLTNFQDIWTKTVPLSVLISFFSIFGLCDLVFEPRWPIFELDLKSSKELLWPTYWIFGLKQYPSVLTIFFLFLAPVT